MLCGEYFQEPGVEPGLCMVEGTPGTERESAVWAQF